ncbi:MAG: TolB family protein [Bacillota bacterium]
MRRMRAPRSADESVRRPRRVLVPVAALLLAVLLPACAQPVPKIAEVEPPTGPGPAVTPAGAGLPPAVTDAVQTWLRDDYTLSHWIAAERGYYLIEMTYTPTGEHAYVWVSSDGSETEFFGMAERASYSGAKDATYRFLSTMVGDSLVVFPYYLAGSPGAIPERTPFYKVPNAETYGISSPGLAYELRKASATDHLDLLFMNTDPDPDGVMAGGGRPPAAHIVENGQSVTARFWYVSLAPGTEEAIRGFSSDAAQLKSASCENGCLELEFDVRWAYSVSLIGEKVEQKPGDRSAALQGYRLSFAPKPAVLDAGESFHDVLATASGLRCGDTTVSAPRLFGEMQKCLLRAFPLGQGPEPGVGASGAEVALKVSGNWLQLTGRYFAGGNDRPSYLQWGERWYEIDPAFDTLLATASLPDRDSFGETPDDVVRRYLSALFLRDWKSAYSCLASAPDRPTLQDFVKWAEGFREWNVSRAVESYSVVQPDTAAVSVSAQRWGSPEERSKWRETWACTRESGVWRLRWQPNPPFLVASLEQIPLWSDSAVSMELRQMETLSPDRLNVLLTFQDYTQPGPARGVAVVSRSLTVSEKDPWEFFSAGEEWVKDYNLAMPLGWVTDTSCLFLVGYDQVDGPHSGAKGISIRQADLLTGKAAEVGFIDKEHGILRSASFLKDRGKAYLHVSGAPGSIWEYDVKSRTLRIVRDDLPAISALFHPEILPRGTLFACGSEEPAKAGIHLIDAATGEERLFLPVGETFSFYPQWSPDGKWVSALTAGRKPGATGSGLDAYDVYPAEDGPAATARKLTVKSIVDGTTWVADAGGKLISWPIWSVDSKRVYFLAGEPGQITHHGPEIAWDSLYSIDLASGAVTESIGFEAISAQVRGEKGYVDLVGGTEHGVVINVASWESGETDYSVWYASIAGPPRKFADGQWEVPFGVATCGGNMAGFVRDLRVGGDYSLWTVGPDGPKALSTCILETTCPGQDVTALNLLTWDDNLVLAVAFSYKTGRSTIMGFRTR